MVGFSYFACTQMEAAVERPPHLKAIMPVAGTWDLYGSSMHHGLMSSGFITPFLYMIGMTAGRTNKLWRSHLLEAVRSLLLKPGVHRKFEALNGEAAIAGLKMILKLDHAAHPWDDLWRAVAVEHPLRDAWGEKRNMLPMLGQVEVPVYLGCDWQNVPLHLPHTFTAIDRLANGPHVQVALMGERGLAWLPGRPGDVAARSAAVAPAAGATAWGGGYAARRSAAMTSAVGGSSVVRQTSRASRSNT
ncbi:CocE/NonD family hydrolase [Variovorax sp. J22R24]|uniref:CocE/NonD family hydrolase n=1 Tax=Variovorax gracilis TaxID=3053502 RepID=UPI002579121E|nr:CocE/NonD family hydrolase [Variovorax sp. J22R24]MDM0108042.1 CocE/NonD family hydrolase [Variovorax sp. J22R24]